MSQTEQAEQMNEEVLVPEAFAASKEQYARSAVGTGPKPSAEAPTSRATLLRDAFNNVLQYAVQDPSREV